MDNNTVQDHIVHPERPEHNYRDTLWMDRAGVDRSEFKPLVKDCTPDMLELILQRMRPVRWDPDEHEYEHPDFIDRYDGGVWVPKVEDPKHRGKQILAAPKGYCKAVWDWLNDNIIVDARGALYSRHRDKFGSGTSFETWDDVASLALTYGDVPKEQQSLKWDRQLELECEHRTISMDGETVPYILQPGVAFRNAVFLRLPNPKGGTKVYMFTPESKGWAKATARPCRLTIDADYDPDIVREALGWAEWLTDDKHSADNLVRFFATPMLEAHKEATYVLYGHGGNGKSLTMDALGDSFPDLAGGMDTTQLIQKGFDGEQHRLALIGKLWVWDDDGDELNSHDINKLKTLSTGGRTTARTIGNNLVEFRNAATIAICTNEAFTPVTSDANARRFAYVRFRDSGGRDFGDYVNFLGRNGAIGWLMASCYLWATAENDIPWHDVSISDSTNASEEDLQVAIAVVLDNAPSKMLEPLFRTEAERKACLERLGLKRGKATTFSEPTSGGGVDRFKSRRLEVENKARFEPYRKLALESINAGDDGEDGDMPDSPDAPDTPDDGGNGGNGGNHGPKPTPQPVTPPASSADTGDGDMTIAKAMVRGTVPARILTDVYGTDAERQECLDRMGLAVGGDMMSFTGASGERYEDRPLIVADMERFIDYYDRAQRLVAAEIGMTVAADTFDTPADGEAEDVAGNATETAVKAPQTREPAEPDMEPAPKPDGSTVPPDSPAIEGGANAVGGVVHCVPCGSDPRDPKRATDWQKRARHEGKYADADTSRPANTPVKADVMGEGMVCLDLDAPHAAGETDGWYNLQNAVGAYGSDALPRTYAVRSCRDGIHLYYRLKPSQMDMKGSVDGNAAGVPKVDVKANMGGYVVGAGSHTKLGDYTLVDVPPDGEAIPFLSDTVYEFLKSHGYTKAPVAPRRPVTRRRFNPMDTGVGYGRGEWHADMTPIPEGQRNQTLYAQAFGRLYNHPENAANIESDFFERGRLSGLPERELEATWKSVVNSIGGVR